ncbi:PAS domain S-box protein [Papillibacter cinnamivorans]|uniref:PAS domain S-box protein n=1 Tax=Papillibacter cinnamivorans TaxID=100176 RepID=UPI001356539E|nr:PAS domain S-box protein [Papillibacter cinnamivorans]
MNLIPFSIVFIDAKDETFCFINKRGLELYKADYTGQTLQFHIDRIKFYTPDGKQLGPTDAPVYRSLKHRETIHNRELILRNEFGDVYCLLVSSAPIYDSGGNVVRAVTTFEDISKLKKIQNLLDSSEIRYRTIVETANEGICWTDSKGVITYINDILASSLGYRPEELIGRHYFDFVLPEDMEKAMTYWKERLAGSSLRFDFRIGKRGGGFIWVIASSTSIRDPEGNYLGSLTMYTDITERKRMEDGLAFHSHVLENVQEAICALDKNYRITYWNEAAERMYGWTAQEAVGKYLANVLNVVIKNASVKEITRKLGENSQINMDMVHYHKNGSAIQVYIHLYAIKNPDGNISEIIASLQDITERKKAEEILIRSEQHLRKNEKMKDDFISLLSHELRNPMAAISAGIELLDLAEKDDKYRETLEVMRRQTEQLGQIVSDLMDVSRLIRSKIKLHIVNTELNGLMLSIAKSYRSLFEKKRVSFHVRLESGPLYIDADPMRLEQCIGNLLHNAVKFTKEGDSVLLSTRKEASSAVISVTDTGYGIHTDAIADLFEPFRQGYAVGESAGPGLGLGLAIAKGIAELHDGRIDAYSDGPGKGASFSVTLPLSQKGGVSAAPADAAEAKNGSVLKILLVEDNKDFVSLLSSILIQMGHSVFIAYDGISGLREARRVSPDILFCDIGLPGISGFEVAKRIKEDPQLRNIYLVALTSYASKNDIQLGEASGFDLYLPKPITIKKLREVLSTCFFRS